MVIRVDKGRYYLLSISLVMVAFTACTVPSTVSGNLLSRTEAQSGKLAATATAMTTTATATKPNIIVVMTDNQEAISAYKVMPAVITRIRDAGTEFTNSFVTTSDCCPSRMTFLTGKLAHNHGVLTNFPPNGGYPTADLNETLPMWLQRSGYHTALIGKVLNGYGQYNYKNNPAPGLPCYEIPPGWNEWYAASDLPNYSDFGKYYDYVLLERGQGMDMGALTLYGSSTATPPPGCTINAGPRTYRTTRYEQIALQFIQNRAAATDDKPFFLFFSASAPHGIGMDGTPGPDPAPGDAGTLAESITKLPDPPSLNEADVSDKPKFYSAIPQLNSAQMESLKIGYKRRLESLVSVDRAVKNMLTTLTPVQAANTIIIFTSDQGQLSGEHRLNTPYAAYDETIHVPLMIAGTGIPAGKNIRELVGNVDLAPTLLALAQAATPAGWVLDGKSLVPLIDGTLSQPWRELLLIEGFGNMSWQRYRGIRLSRGDAAFSYIEYRDGDGKPIGEGGIEYYEVIKDPYQLINKPSAAPTTIKSLLETLSSCAGDSCWK